MCDAQLNATWLKNSRLEQLSSRLGCNEVQQESWRVDIPFCGTIQKMSVSYRGTGNRVEESIRSRIVIASSGIWWGS